MLYDLRNELAGFATLAMFVAESSAGDISIAQHIGAPLDGFVRRLDVAIELLERCESGRRARGRGRK